MAIHLPAKQIEDALAQDAQRFVRRLGAVEDQREMQDDHIKTAVNRVRNAVSTVERRLRACATMVP